MRIALVVVGVIGFAHAAAPAQGALPRIDTSDADRCDFIAKPNNGLCLLPFPDDYYTVSDPDTLTGRRINLKTAAMPANIDGKHVDARPYNLNDGFSQGQPIVLKVPGLNTPAAMDRTGAAPINHMGRYRDPGQPIVLLDADTGKRVPIWSEIDSNATKPARVALEIHPARNLAAQHRYIVALRNLKTASGETIQAPAAFRYYRDRVPSDQQAINQRRNHFEGIFQTLKNAGIGRQSLYLAWDFTVASDWNIAQRVLGMRRDAFAELGDTKLADRVVQGTSPAFDVTSVTNFTLAQNPRVAREVKGTFTVPCFLAPDCAPGGRFQLNDNGVPTRHGDWTANFDCIIPRSAVQGTPSPARPSLYGHGLFGSASEVTSSGQAELANTYNFVLCATDEIGMSSSDLPNTAGIIRDLSEFPELADRLQQGLLDELYLGRVMIHRQGFSSHPAFHVNGTLGTPSVIDRSQLYYDGNSQGGIMGGALTAISPDFTRAALGVPAMRYSLLLPRSVDFDSFAAILYPRYPDELARPLLLSLIQMLWDRGEPNGFAHRMTDVPLPNTPPHKVLLNVAFGDHQVTNWAADVEARTIGASTHTPILDPGRWPDVDELFGIPRIQSYPFTGSAIVYWDIGPVRPDPDNPGQTIGVPPPPMENVPNREGEDPHGAPRGAPDALKMVSQFLRPQGAITDVCAGHPCYAGGWTGP
ncbi:MAG TPA: hypothetical protein VN458_07965 [Solirubrobacterales bacterium]|nr:hypothetical protein [Solirubrobacterales bacterium]